MLKNFEVQNGVITIGGFTIEKLRDTINERQFVRKNNPVQKLNYKIRNFKFTNEELNDIQKYIRIPESMDNYIDISSKGWGWCDHEWLMFGFNADEISKALSEYRKRESYLDPKSKFIGYYIPMYTDLLKIHREKENT